MRARRLEEVAGVLRGNGYVTEIVATNAAGSAGEQARAAVAAGATHVFACGGDGTVHDVLQGMVREGGDSDGAGGAVLGVIPMGSANALARHLGLSMSPVEAAWQQIRFVPRSVSVGRVEFSGQRRYFAVMAGAGPDGALMYRMLAGEKQRLGRLAYYVRAAGVYATHRHTAFDLEYVEHGTLARVRMRAVSAMAVRVGDLGGLFSRVVPQGDVGEGHLRLVAVRPPGWLALPLWFVTGWLGMGRWNRLLRSVAVEEFSCTPVRGGRVHVQADGDWLGTAPMRVTLVRDGVRLLMPDVPARN